MHGMEPDDKPMPIPELTFPELDDTDFRQAYLEFRAAARRAHAAQLAAKSAAERYAAAVKRLSELAVEEDP